MSKSELNKKEIEALLPHREPMLLIDKLTNIVHLKSATAVMYVKKNGFYVQGHFPNQPVMPGVLSLESIAQTTAFLMLHELDDPMKKNMFISGVDKVRFRRLITPGDQLCINIRLKMKKLNLYKFEGNIKINDKLTVQALITSNLVDRVEV